MSNIRDLQGAVSLIAKFDTAEDDKQIDSIICHAITSGLDIEAYEEEAYDYQEVI